MIDFTEVKSFFGFGSHVVALVLDVFSRMPLAASVFDAKPNAAQVVALISPLATTPVPDTSSPTRTVRSQPPKPARC